MLVSEFKDKVQNLFNSNSLEFKAYKGDEGGHWYSIELNVGLFEIYIATDGVIGINLPSENDSISFGGCDEAYDDLSIALDRIKTVIDSEVSHLP